MLPKNWQKPVHVISELAPRSVRDPSRQNNFKKSAPQFFSGQKLPPDESFPYHITSATFSARCNQRYAPSKINTHAILPFCTTHQVDTPSWPFLPIVFYKVVSRSGDSKTEETYCHAFVCGILEFFAFFSPKNFYSGKSGK